MSREETRKLFRRQSDPYDNKFWRAKLHKTEDSRYGLEIGEGHKFLSAAKERLGRNFDFRRLLIFRLLLLGLLLLLAGRVWWLQIARGQYYRQLADGNRIRILEIEPRRGVIYDRFKRPLVRNVANFVLYFIPADLPDDEATRRKILDRLKVIVGDIDTEELNKKIAAIKPGAYEDYQPLFAADNLEYEKAMLVYLESADMPGVFLDSKSRREYQLSALSLSHVLGYTGKISAAELEKFGTQYSMLDYIGKTGLEKYWEKELKGVSGKKQVEVDALGKEKRVISQSKTVDGLGLWLSLDYEAQAKLEQLIAAEMTAGGFKRAAGIVSDPESGEIIALVSLPTFNNNDFAKGISEEAYRILSQDQDQPLFNRAVSGEYPPGSTIKPVGVSAALEAGVLDEHKQFLSSGGLWWDKWFFPDWKSGGHGLTDARKAIAESVNTYMYYIGGGYDDFQGLGLDRLTDYYKKFGLGKPSGLDLPGEASGFIPSKAWKESVKNEAWYIGDTYHIAIGQGDLLATPLQINAYTNYFANGGKFYRPHLVKGFLNRAGEQTEAVKTIESEPSPISSANIEVVKQGMRQAVTSGSARRLNSLPVEAAGKTGTAQFSSVKKPHAWFTGFAPLNRPQISITILIEEGVEGSAGPTAVADKFMRWYFGERLTGNQKPVADAVGDTATGSPSILNP